MKASGVLSEAQIQSSILEYLKIKNIFAWRNNSGAMVSEYAGKKRFMRFGISGGPDILGILQGGRSLSIECKSAKGKLSPAQLSFRNRAIDCGGAYIEARSVEDVIKYLEGK